MNDEQDPKTMNPFDEAEDNRRDVDDVLVGLRALGEAIDRQRYPGRAWRPAARRRGRPAVIWLTVATAAAAAVLLAVSWFWPAGAPQRPGVRIAEDKSPPESTTQVVKADEEDPLVWAVPSDVDPSLAGGLDFTVPSVSILPASDGDGIEWTIPSVSFPELQEERNTNDDQKESIDDVGGGGADRGSDGDVDNGPSARARPAARRPTGGKASAV